LLHVALKKILGGFEKEGQHFYNFNQGSKIVEFLVVKAEKVTEHLTTNYFDQNASLYTKEFKKWGKEFPFNKL
jgi:hypothetical protein